MDLPLHKTKIVCTIGPASRSPHVLRQMVSNGMDVARLNFSHGSYEEHSENIKNVRAAAQDCKRLINILIDLPGTKMRVGKLPAPLMLTKGQSVVLTTKSGVRKGFIPVDYKKLIQSASKGTIIYLNDGFIQLKVDAVKATEVYCKVIVGGELLSHKGLNIPGAQLFVNAITRQDLDYVKFGLSQGVRCFGLSFVEKASDVHKVRQFAKDLGKTVFLVAKIERREAIRNFDEILKVADAVMIARGDLGVEIPLQEVPIIQKQLISKANVAGKPVIIATQMLESMTHNIRPTRAEVSDVANGILDGADAVMLSEETAVGQYPVETLATMAKIAQATEEQRNAGFISNDETWQIRRMVSKVQSNITDVISLNVVNAVEQLKARYILTLTSSGSTARRISRFKPSCWILALTLELDTCFALSFSYGVYPLQIHQRNISLEAMLAHVKKCMLAKKGDRIIITERRLALQPGQTDALTVAVLS